tara:strand:+ start:244 stop:936 length:693 start_codon:yes stop_codon:yes gene_type:complete
MSSYVDKEWFYYLRGREVLIYKILGGSSTSRISQNGVLQSYDKELMYPDEDIADGLRIEYTRVSEPFVKEALEDTNIFMNGITFGALSASNRIIDSANGFTASKFAANDGIRVRGSSTFDGDYTISSVDGSAAYIVLNENISVDESAGERISITQIPVEDSSPSATSHVNLNKMLGLAVLDYCKAMLAEKNGEIDKKEYFMKEFFSRLGDNESNKRNISVTFPSGPFAVK